jgi:histidinol-phosphatase
VGWVASACAPAAAWARPPCSSATAVVGSPSIDEDLAFALELADAADDITLPRYRATDLVVETKPDLTPVTEADQAAEKALRACIEAERPRDGSSARSTARRPGQAAALDLDPIDGTKSYVRGIPAGDADRAEARR